MLVGMFLMPLFYGVEEPNFTRLQVFLPIALGGLAVGECSGAALVYMIQGTTGVGVESEG